MVFKKSCFIRKNTEELRVALKNIGYSNSHVMSGVNSIATSAFLSTYVEMSEHLFDYKNPHVTWNCGGRIDCGENEDMFLALAALRDDSDIHQWMIVTDLKGINWIKSVENKFTGDAVHSIWKKATVDDIIEHFKTK